MPFFCCRTQWPDTSRLAGFESKVGRGKPNSPPRNLLSRFVPWVLALSLTDLLLHELFVRVTHSKRWPYECCRKTDGEQSESSTHFSSIHHNQPRCNCNSSSPNAEWGQRRREEKKESDATPCKTKLQCEYIWMVSLHVLQLGYTANICDDQHPACASPCAPCLLTEFPTFSTPSPAAHRHAQTYIIFQWKGFPVSAFCWRQENIIKKMLDLA